MLYHGFCWRRLTGMLWISWSHMLIWRTASQKSTKATMLPILVVHPGYTHCFCPWVWCIIHRKPKLSSFTLRSMTGHESGQPTGLCDALSCNASNMRRRRTSWRSTASRRGRPWAGCASCARAASSARSSASSASSTGAARRRRAATAAPQPLLPARDHPEEPQPFPASAAGGPAALAGDRCRGGAAANEAAPADRQTVAARQMATATKSAARVRRPSCVSAPPGRLRRRPPRPRPRR
jgi:hypothetical protein